MKRTSARQLGCLMEVLCIGLMACAGAPVGTAEREPILVEELTPTFGDDGRGQLVLSLRIDNPRREEIKLTGFDCQVFLDRRWFAAAEGILTTVLPAGSDAPFQLRVPWAVRRGSSGPAEPAFVDVEVRGRMKLVRGRSSDELPFGSKARLKLSGFPTRGVDEAL